MQTLFLGSPAAQEPLESFFQRFGNDSVEIIGPDGNRLARVVPSSEFAEKDAEADRAYQEKVYRKLEPEILADLEELKKRAARPAKGMTKEELLQYLNSLPLPS